MKKINSKRRRVETTLRGCRAGAAAALSIGLAAGGAAAQEIPTQAPMIGAIESWTIDNPADVYSASTITVGGQAIRIPRNFVIDLPANRLTAAQFVAQAAGACAGTGQTGLAADDGCQGQEGSAIGVATILANRTTDGTVVAGDVMIEKGQELLSGIVTFVHHTRGYFRVAGTLGADEGGTIVRINDPSARFTIQRGPGCRPGPGTEDNCSADIRFGVDSDNYTVTFATGYPGCIPSTRHVGNSPAGDPRVANRDRGTGFRQSNAAGRNDAYCPHTNRQGNPAVADAERFAPIQAGDHIAAEGNTETVRGTTFLSAHTVVIHTELTTGPLQPNYMIFDEVEWDIAGYQNERVRTLLIGFSTELGAQGNPEVYAVDINPETQEVQERLFASVAGCELAEGAGTCAGQGIAPAGANIWRIRYDVDFINGVDDRRSPCLYLNALAASGQTIGGEPVASPCSTPFTIAEDAGVLIPPSRDLIGRTRRKSDNPDGFDVRDLTGNPAPWGEYLNPVGLGHPEFVEINLAAIQTPFLFTGPTWNLDRRTGPGGCVDLAGDPVDCSTDIDVTLDPFPFSCLDPAGQLQAAAPPGGLNNFRNDILSIPTGGGTNNIYNAIVNAANCPIAPALAQPLP